jgi:hypothetical protein
MFTMTSSENPQHHASEALTAAADNAQVDLLGWMELRGQRARAAAAGRAGALLGGADGEFEPVDPAYLQQRLADDPQPPRDAS